MLEDRQLLDDYARNRSEAAFSEIVSRYISLVYSTALRRVGNDAHLAQDVSQLVFTDLARKAGSLPRSVVLAGWLHRATQFAAAQAMRAERRRQMREQEAVAMNGIKSESAPNWQEIRPLIDEALDDLNQTDRDAVLLRFMEQHSVAEVANVLGTSERAARKRVDRALEKLRVLLVRRGVTTTAAALGGAISANAMQGVPIGLAATVTGASLAGAAAGATTTTFSLLKIMGMTKLKAGLIGGAIVASAATTLVIQDRAEARTRDQDRLLRQQTEQLAQLQTEQDRLAKGVSPAAQRVDLAELEHLRAAAVPLRKQAQELASLKREEQRLRERLDQARKDLRSTDTNWQETVTSTELDEKNGYAMSLTLAMHEYASKHNGLFPTNLEDTLKYFREEDRGITNLSPSQFEIMFHGTRSDIAKYAHPERIILVKEKQPWQNVDGKSVIAWSSLNGMGCVCCPADGKFDQWVSDHTVQTEMPNP